MAFKLKSPFNNGNNKSKTPQVDKYIKINERVSKKPTITEKANYAMEGIMNMMTVPLTGQTVQERRKKYQSEEADKKERAEARKSISPVNAYIDDSDRKSIMQVGRNYIEPKSIITADGVTTSLTQDDKIQSKGIDFSDFDYSPNEKEESSNEEEKTDNSPVEMKKKQLTKTGSGKAHNMSAFNYNQEQLMANISGSEDQPTREDVEAMKALINLQDGQSPFNQNGGPGDKKQIKKGVKKKLLTTPMTAEQKIKYENAVKAYQDSTESWIQGKGPEPMVPDYTSFKKSK